MLKRIGHYLPDLKECWVLVFFLCVAGALGAGGIILLLSRAAGSDPMSADTLVQYLLPFIPPAVYVYLKGGRPTDFSGGVPVNRSDFGSLHPVLFFGIITIVTLSLMVMSDPVSEWIPVPDSFRQLFEKIASGESASAVITITAAAPVMEEWLCRGIMERGLLVHGTPAKAILWSAFFFALIHMNPWQAVPAFIFGLLLGWIYWRTHSIWACMFIHFVNNGTVYGCLLLHPHLGADAQLKDLFPPDFYPVLYGMSVLLTAAGMLFLHRKLGTGDFSLSQ